MTVEWPEKRAWPYARPFGVACADALSAMESFCRQGGRLPVEELVCTNKVEGVSLKAGVMTFGPSGADDGYDIVLSFIEQYTDGKTQ